MTFLLEQFDGALPGLTAPVSTERCRKVAATAYELTKVVVPALTTIQATSNRQSAPLHHAFTIPWIGEVTWLHQPNAALENRQGRTFQSFDEEIWVRSHDSQTAARFHFGQFVTRGGNVPIRETSQCNPFHTPPIAQYGGVWVAREADVTLVAPTDMGEGVVETSFHTDVGGWHSTKLAQDTYDDVFATNLRPAHTPTAPEYTSLAAAKTILLDTFRAILANQR
jgi:hypothetical protein